MSKHHQNMSSSRWKALRERVMRRDDYTCRSCGVACPKQHLQVDHIRAIADGGAVWSSDNLRSLCRICHNTVTRRQGWKRQGLDGILPSGLKDM